MDDIQLPKSPWIYLPRTYLPWKHSWQHSPLLVRTKPALDTSAARTSAVDTPAVCSQNSSNPASVTEKKETLLLYFFGGTIKELVISSLPRSSATQMIKTSHSFISNQTKKTPSKTLIGEVINEAIDEVIDEAMNPTSAVQQ